MRTFTTQDITEVNLDQIIITRTVVDNKASVRVRANATVTLVDSLDSIRTTTMNVSINNTPQELGIGAELVSIRTAVLNALKDKIT